MDSAENKYRMAIIFRAQETLPPFAGQSLFKMDWGRSGKLSCGMMSQFLKFFLEIIDTMSSRLREERTHPPTSQHPWCICAHGMGNLHICEGSINVEWYIQVLEQHILPSRQRLFQTTLLISARQCQTTFYTYSLSRSFLRSYRGLLKVVTMTLT